jgi:hypothetical protein
MIGQLAREHNTACPFCRNERLLIYRLVQMPFIFEVPYQYVDFVDRCSVVRCHSVLVQY